MTSVQSGSCDHSTARSTHEEDGQQQKQKRQQEERSEAKE